MGSTRSVLILVVLTCAAGLRLLAQEAPTLRRQVEYTGVWPFYSREVFEGGASRTTVLAGLARTTTEPDGDYHHHLLPLYDVSVADEGRDRSLAIFPLLYFSRRSPESSYDHVLPLFSRWRTGDSSHLVSWLLLHVASNPQETPYRFIPTLVRLGSREHGNDQRVGVPFLLSLFEHAGDPSTSRWAIGSLFNFGDTARGGFPLGRFARDPDGETRSHLFPLFASRRGGPSWYVHTLLIGVWEGEEAEGGRPRGLIVPPLLFLLDRQDAENVTAIQFPTFVYSRRSESDLLFVLPLYLAGTTRSPPTSMRFYSLLYGRTENEDADSVSHWFPLLLSRVGRREGRPRVDVLWPLGHYARHEDGFTLRALPFVDRSVRGPESDLGVGAILFRRFTDSARGIRSTWAPLPLVHWKTSPDGLLAWAAPAFYHERWAEEAKRGHLTIGLPVFVSRRVEERVEDGSWVPSERSLHLWPLWGFEGSNRFESVEVEAEPGAEGETDVVLRRAGEGGDEYDERAWSTLHPFFRVEKSGHESDPTGVERRVHAPWPLVLHRRDPESYDAALRPLLFTGAHPTRRYFRMWPALSIEAGADAESDLWTDTSLIQWRRDDAKQYFRLFPLLFESYTSWDAEGAVKRRRVWGPLFLFLYDRTPGEGWFHLAPLGFGSWSEAGSSLGVFPFFYRREFGDEIDYWTAGRFFFLWNSLESERESHSSLLWKALDWTSTAEGEFDFRILHRLVVNRSVGGQREFTFNPFFTSFEDERTGERRFSIFKFVYRSDVEDGVETRRVFFIPIWKGEAQ